MLESRVCRTLSCRLIGAYVLLATFAGTKESSPQTAATESPKTAACLEEAQQDPVSAFDLDREEARRRHVWVAQDPGDIESRALLLKDQFKDRLRSDKMRLVFENNALWIIEHRPEADIAGTPYVSLLPHPHPEGFMKARALWAEHLALHESPAILWNAAGFFAVPDRTLALSLLERGGKLEPGNPRWSDAREQVVRFADAHRREVARALGELEAALPPVGSGSACFCERQDVTVAAWMAGEYEKARRYASELLESAQGVHYGDAIHEGNRILGHLALREGDVVEAKARLLKAGATPGSPVLNSFGPELTLARDLLKKGERDTVVQYLEMCARFWKSSRSDLKRVIAQIRAGKTPDLGPAWQWHLRSAE